MGYKWVFYWPSIFLAFTFVFLFLFLEETNYSRETIGVVEASTSAGSPAGSVAGGDVEKHPPVKPSASSEAAPVSYTKKTYWQKLALWDKRRPNHFFQRIERQLLFLGWPVIFYAGYDILALQGF
jgi:hypothetical protein